MTTIYDICFANASTKGFVEVARGGIARSYRSWLPIDKLYQAPTTDEDIDCYFGPAVRIRSGKLGKANCKGSWVCWVDADYARPIPNPVLPPTAIVRSGHGWHLYWQLLEFCVDVKQLEAANKSLASHIGGDSAHNIDRLLRQPGTLNSKEEPPALCNLRDIHPERTYLINELTSITSMDPKMARKILSGTRQGYPSRSERDFAIIRELVRLELSDDTIALIFQNHACGDKYRDPETRGESYLARTIKKVRELHTPGGTASAAKSGKRSRTVTFTEQDKCYFVSDGRGERQLSTFVFHPTMLLEGKQDYLMGDIQAQSTDFVWKGVVWPRSAFSGLSSLGRELTKLSWVWLGRDAEIRSLLNHLVVELTKQGIPRAVAVQQLGRHTIGDQNYAVFDNCTISSDGSVWWDMKQAPIVYVATDREAPTVTLVDLNFDHQQAAQLDELLTQLNRPEALWPTLGWFMATAFKPAIEALGYRFPILNVTGTRGSGKTTLLLEVMQPLLGVCDARGYDASTTRFVALTLLGSTNAVAVNFSEFRVAMTQDFLRFILLAYDAGKDARGRPDQTTVEYPLSAPFTVDGEDKVSDSAALERVVVVSLTPKTIEEESEAWCALNALQELVDLRAFALPYWKFTLQVDVAELLQEAKNDIYDAFPQRLPTRIRRNLIVAWMGVRAYQAFMSDYGVYTEPELGAEVLCEALSNVYSTALGRATTAADEFAEFVANAAAQQSRAFPWELEGTVLWFQHTPAFEYFLSRRASQRQSTLTREALKIQLRELIEDYTVAPVVRMLKGRKVMAYGIDLQRAHRAGLDVPEAFNSNSIVFDF